MIISRRTAHAGRVTQLLLWQLCALSGQVIAVALARQGHRVVAEAISDVSLMTIYASALWILTATRLDRSERNAAVLCLGLAPTLFWRATNPMLFTGFDEQLHMRTLGDILSSHRLFEANPLLEVSPRYPGLEVLATLGCQCGLPAMVAAYLVILACRATLVTVLCDAVEQLTGSDRAGGLAVAVYALSSQFVFFNSQFAYQTLALPLALGAVSFIARARGTDDPMPFLFGATLCLFALGVTHHVSSFITAGFLVVWAFAEKGRARLWVTYGACTAVACTLIWALFQRQLLSDYFGPIIDDVHSQFVGGARRKLFKDSAGTASRTLDKYLLLYYAAALAFGAGTVLLLTHRERNLRRGPHLLLAALSAAIPLFLAARVLPKGGDLFDRSNSFLFFPLSVSLAGFAAWYWWREPQQVGFSEQRRVRNARWACIVLVSGVFLGGYVLGTGPDWARLPGPYMPAADTRSMDAETLAANKWARSALPPGSRIAGDRVASDLLAAQAGVWPVMKGPGGVDAPALYVAEQWGMTETDMAAAMELRYLYVDVRLADQLPPFGSYFFSGETGGGEQLTESQLTKFDHVPGIKVLYRHGPVSIYDLQGLGVPELRSGWYKATPKVRVPIQLAVGLLCGLFVAAVMRSSFWPRIVQTALRLRRSWGPAMTGVGVLAGVCLFSMALLLTGVWLTPVTIWSGVLVVGVVKLPAILGAVRRGVPWRGLRTVVFLAVLAGIVAAAAIWVALPEDFFQVNRILTDPLTIQVAPTNVRR